MTNIVNKKYVIGIFITIMFVLLLFLWNKGREENIYILYDNISDCKYIKESEKKQYHLCDKDGNMYIFKKIDNSQIKFINNVEKFRLTSKKDFLKKIKYRKNKKINIFLFVKKGNLYEILQVKMYQVLS